MWSGVEPEPQQYNVTYLNVMKNIIELLESNSIFVLLDMHQDVLSTRTGGYMVYQHGYTIDFHLPFIHVRK